MVEPRFTHATGDFATRYSGNRQANTEGDIANLFRLQDLSRGAPITTWNLNGSTDISTRVHITDNDNNWTAAEHAVNENDMGLDIHWGLQRIYDHLQNRYGINSFDDNGFSIDAHIRYGMTQIERDNARWDLENNILLFGDGFSLFRPIASLDVVGHEFGHGIVDFQMGWAYNGNGAVFHEGIADIFGVIFEYRIKPSASSNWKIGEEITITSPILRNLQNTNDPSAHNKIADTFQSSQYNSGDRYVRSGVFSHWFYALVNGESGTNDLGNSYNVAGIGMDKAEDLMIFAIYNHYLDYTATYPDVRTAMINAATARYCSNSPEVASVTSAWHAVGVGNAFSGAVVSITGADPICSSQSFSVQNQVPGALLFWSSSNTAQMSVSPMSATTTTVSRVNNYNGAVTLTLNMSGLGGCLAIVTKVVQIGAFGSGQITVTGTSNICPGNIYTYTAQVPGNHRSGYTYNWIKPANWTVNSQTANTISFYVPQYSPNYGAVQVSVNNGCGFSGYSGITTYPNPGCGGGYYFTTFPNPSSTELVIELVEGDSDVAADVTDIENSEYSVELRTDSGKILLSTKSTGKTVAINTERYPRGLYILRIIFREKVLTERVLIE